MYHPAYYNTSGRANPQLYLQALQLYTAMTAIPNTCSATFFTELEDSERTLLQRGDDSDLRNIPQYGSVGG